jgi:hypothetical protein
MLEEHVAQRIALYRGKAKIFCFVCFAAAYLMGVAVLGMKANGYADLCFGYRCAALVKTIRSQPTNMRFSYLREGFTLR